MTISILCPSEALATKLVCCFPNTSRENWAPFHAWRARIQNADQPHTPPSPETERGAGGRGSGQAHPISPTPQPPTHSWGRGGASAREQRTAAQNEGAGEIFILVCGEGARAAGAGALQLLATRPEAPILLLDYCRPCDPSLRPGELVLIESASAFDKEQLYLLHASPAPLESLPCACANDSLLCAAEQTGQTIRRVSCGSCDARMDFPSQRDWLARKYGFQVFDAVSHSVGNIIKQNNGAWLPAGIVVPWAWESEASIGSGIDNAIEAFAKLIRQITQSAKTGHVIF